MANWKIGQYEFVLSGMQSINTLAIRIKFTINSNGEISYNNNIEIDT